jgi:hypothetical protein
MNEDAAFMKDFDKRLETMKEQYDQKYYKLDALIN